MRQMNRMAAVAGAAVALSLAGAVQASSFAFAHEGGFGGNVFGSVNVITGNPIGASNLGDVTTAAYSAMGLATGRASLFLYDIGGDAGIVLYALWEHHDPNNPASFSAQLAVAQGSPPGSPVNDGGPWPGTPTAGDSEVFTFGATTYSAGVITGTANVSDPTPAGFAITNMQNFLLPLHGPDSLSIQFTGMLGITDWDLYSWDGTGVNVVTSGSSGFETLILAVPLPAPVWMGLAGLVGVIALRRRLY